MTGMADQATLLGHPEEGRRLAQAGRAAEHARLSIAHARKQKRARRGAMSQAALAVSHLQRDDLEAAHLLVYGLSR
jgi:hypothetical protein